MHFSTAFRTPSLALAFLALLFGANLPAQDTSKVINDITQLNPVRVQTILVPEQTAQIVGAVKNHRGPISIGGGRYSMGGQTAKENSLHIDMRRFDSILFFSPEQKLITVQTGITWRSIQEFIDPHNLSVQIMQTYANFTVGGSLSVNVHGRYIGQGPLILSVRQIRIVLADGTLVTASPDENSAIFYGAIGGYGGLGVITEATLSLTDNVKVERTDRLMPISAYAGYFSRQVGNDSLSVFHNADIYPNKYREVRAISYRRTEKEVTVRDRLKPLDNNYRFNRFAFRVIAGCPGGKWIRRHLIDPVLFRNDPVEWRNYEASYDVQELEPKSRKKTTYVLQEYFVPADRFDELYPKMAEILRRNDVNVINISIRHAKKDPGSLLAWAKTDVFAFVLYYRQGTSGEDKTKTGNWTRELIDAAISCGGSYYLPYQVHATPEQFAKAYPRSAEFFALKKKLDPENKFRNKLWDAYFK